MTSVLSQIFADGKIYLLLYTYFFAIVIIETAYENERFSRIMGRLGAIILIGFVGFRWETGTDWSPYFKIFYTSEYSSDYDVTVFGIDIGYLLLNKIVAAISSNYSTFLLVDAAIAIAGVYYFIEKSTKFPNMGIYLFYTSYVITHFMGSNRRMLAIGFVCVGFVHLTKGVSIRSKWLTWAAPFSVAALFHRTAVSALPGLVVSRRAWPAPVVVIALVVSAALGISGLPFAALEGLGSFLGAYAHITIINKLLFYTSSGEVQATGDFDVMWQASLGIVKRSTILAILVSFMTLSKPSEHAQRLYNIYVTGCVIYFLLIGSPVFQVVSTYYTIVEIVLIPIVFSNLPKIKVPYLFYLAIVPLLLMITALSPYLQLYVPYLSIFSTF